jgi:hypothetical protein
MVQLTLLQWSRQALLITLLLTSARISSIGGFTDWYLPARYELDIAYFNLKPSTQANDTSWGSNVYSVPQREH